MAQSGHFAAHKQQPTWQSGHAPAQALLMLRAFNRGFRLIQMFTPALSIHLATGFLIEDKAGVVKRCRSPTRFGTKYPCPRVSLPRVSLIRLIPRHRFGSKADIGVQPDHVRFTPESGRWNSAAECPLCANSRHSALRQRLALFDHLVGAAKKRERNCETQCFGSLLVDHQLKLCRLLDW